MDTMPIMAQVKENFSSEKCQRKGCFLKRSRILLNLKTALSGATRLLQKHAAKMDLVLTKVGNVAASVTSPIKLRAAMVVLVLETDGAAYLSN